MRSPAEAEHVVLFTDLLSSMMRGTAGPAEWRIFFAVQIAKGLGRGGPLGDRGIHPDAASPRIPDEIIAVEARYCVLAAPWLSAWHGDALSFIEMYTCGDRNKCRGMYSWGTWLGGVSA
jgi:hypothetical protein